MRHLIVSTAVTLDGFSAGPGGDSTRTRLGHALRKWALAGGVLALATWLLWLLVLTPMMSGLPLAQAWSWPILEAVMTQTWFGTVWLVRVGLLLLFIYAIFAMTLYMVPPGSHEQV